MTVYVDNFMVRADVPNGDRVVRGRWCHMTADTREELDAMADLIGLRRSWIQHPGTWKEHYDVTMTKRAAAVRAGAVEITLREAVALHKARRAALAGTTNPARSPQPNTEDRSQ
ncbi:hypothetical protein CH252_19080 [Rhodococcus sp. 06-1477-1B]|nr:hypothetical protein CH252_19080 [Rhodococcus sp. 06-1477-1B]